MAKGEAGLVNAKTSNLRWFRDNKQVDKTRRQAMRSSRQNLSSPHVTALCLIPCRSPSQALSCVWCLCVVSGCARCVISLTSAPHHPLTHVLELSCPLTPAQGGWLNTFRSSTTTRDDKSSWLDNLVQKLGKICLSLMHVCSSYVISDKDKDSCILSTP